MKHCTLLVSFMLLLVVSTGCGDKSSVSGKVSFDDGTPLNVGKVMFTDGTNSGFGKINEKGEYKMGMTKEGEGMPNGSYQVYIMDASKEDPSLSRASDDGETFTPKVLIIDPKFTNPKQSELKCDVSGKTTFDIKVTKPGPDYNPQITTGD